MMKSERAEEFISDAEIRETMAYAEAHKDDRPLIVSILEKARLCKGLTHREAAVLLASGQQDLTEEMFALARDIKQRFLWQPHRDVRSVVPFQLLCERLRVLPIPCQEQDDTAA